MGKKKKILLIILLIFLCVDLIYGYNTHILDPSKDQTRLKNIDVKEINKVKIETNSKSILIEEELLNKFMSEFKKQGVSAHHSGHSREKNI